ncbi:MAG: hypothetical protein JSS09_08945 [Verrucomicrobia bacterium]|nr:hypothetical protein [Verrucomicrobiota bacterium]
MVCVEIETPSIRDVGTLVAAPIIAGATIYAAKICIGMPRAPRNEKINAVVTMTMQGAVIGGTAAVIDNLMFGGAQPYLSTILAGAGVGAGIALSTWAHRFPLDLRTVVRIG